MVATPYLEHSATTDWLRATMQLSTNERSHTSTLVWRIDCMNEAQTDNLQEPSVTLIMARYGGVLRALFPQLRCVDYLDCRHHQASS